MSSIENYISVYLQRDDDFNDFSVHIPMNQVYFIKNPYDYSCYQCASKYIYALFYSLIYT